MGSVYSRQDSPFLWLKWRSADGQRHQERTRYRRGDPDQLAEAKRALELLERRVSAEKRAAAGVLTVRAFAASWTESLEKRGVVSVGQFRARLRDYVYPEMGELPLREVRPHHLAELMEALSAREPALAPRTRRGIYAMLHAMFHQALRRELVLGNPCALEKHELPKVVDRDPTWRARAVFARSEVERLLSDQRIRADRRPLYAALFLTGMRIGEALERHWSEYDAGAEPLGRLHVTTSWSSLRNEASPTKTRTPREVPVHPLLAQVLAEWRLRGWPAWVGRPPRDEDLIFPGRGGGHRDAPGLLRRFHYDLEKLGLRERRLHDSRRTFISLATADGGLPHLLKGVTHGYPSSTFDQYNTPPWAETCAAVAKLNIRRLGAREVTALAMAAHDGRAHGRGEVRGDAGGTGGSHEALGGERHRGWRGGRAGRREGDHRVDLEAHPGGRCAAPGGASAGGDHSGGGDHEGGGGVLDGLGRRPAQGVPEAAPVVRAAAGAWDARETLSAGPTASDPRGTGEADTEGPDDGPRRRRALRRGTRGSNAEAPREEPGFGGPSTSGGRSAPGPGETPGDLSAAGETPAGADGEDARRRGPLPRAEARELRSATVPESTRKSGSLGQWASTSSVDPTDVRGPSSALPPVVSGPAGSLQSPEQPIQRSQPATVRVCDAAVEVLRETGNPAVMATDSGLLHAIAERAGRPHKGFRTEKLVLDALSRQPGELVPGYTRAYRNQRARIFRLPDRVVPRGEDQTSEDRGGRHARANPPLAHASEGGHARPGLVPAAGNVTEPRPSPGSGPPARRPGPPIFPEEPDPSGYLRLAAREGLTVQPDDDGGGGGP